MCQARSSSRQSATAAWSNTCGWAGQTQSNLVKLLGQQRAATAHWLVSKLLSTQYINFSTFAHGASSLFLRQRHLHKKAPSQPDRLGSEVTIAQARRGAEHTARARALALNACLPFTACRFESLLSIYFPQSLHIYRVNKALYSHGCPHTFIHPQTLASPLLSALGAFTLRLAVRPLVFWPPFCHDHGCFASDCFLLLNSCSSFATLQRSLCSVLGCREADRISVCVCWLALFSVLAGCLVCAHSTNLPQLCVQQRQLTCNFSAGPWTPAKFSAVLSDDASRSDGA